MSGELTAGYYWCRYCEVKCGLWEIYSRNKNGWWEEAFSGDIDWKAKSDADFERMGYEIGARIEDPNAALSAQEDKL